MKKRSNLKTCMELIKLVKPLTGYMLMAIIMGIIGHLCAAFITILGGTAFLSLLGIAIPYSIQMVFIMVLVLALMRGVLHYGEQAFNHFIAFKILALIRCKVFASLRRLCPAKLDGKDKGNLISIITSDIELLEVFYAHTISPIVIAFLMSLIMFLFISSYHWLLGIIALTAYLLVGILLPFVTSKYSGENGNRLRMQSGELASFTLESLRGLPEILQFGTGEKQLADIHRKTHDLLAEDEKMKVRAGKNTAITGLVILCFDFIMLFVASLLYMKGIIQFDGVLIPFIALMSSFGPVIALSNLGSGLQNTFAAGRRVLDILEEEPIVEDIKGKPSCAFSGAAVENVHFSYDQEEILSAVTMNIPQRSVIGITGKSGSGKSTLLKLMMRFWSVNEGKITVSDQTIDQINTTDLRAMQGYVTQETHLFQGSIADNIRFVKPNATQVELEDACRKAAVHDFIANLPNGYNTSVGELGSKLSGGERQRLGLARAFLHNAPFLLLDEPTSNLDSLNEAVILKSIDKERGKKTVLLVSHRASTMRLADMVYRVENGRIS